MTTVGNRAADRLAQRKRLTHAAAGVAVFVALGLIARATLVPVSGPGAHEPFWCLWCGDFSLADALANVALFVPLGWALAATDVGLGWSVAVVIGTTVGVELLQHDVVPGRVSSASDVFANTLGGAVGIALPRVQRWLAVSGVRALRATAVYGALLGVGTWGGVVAQAISLPPVLRWDAQSPDLPGYTTFTGDLRAIRVDGTPAAMREWHPVPPREPVEVAVDVVAGFPDPRRAEIVSAQPPSGPVWMWVDQEGRDLRVHLASMSDALRLRGHTPRLADAMPPVAGDAITIQLIVHPFSYRLAVTTAQGDVIRAADISPGDGWRLLAPFERDREAWAPLLSGVWLAALLGPLGYVAALRSRTAALVAAGGAATYLLLLPFLAGCASLSPVGWCGAAGGLAVGAGAGRVAEPNAA